MVAPCLFNRAFSHIFKTLSLFSLVSGPGESPEIAEEEAARDVLRRLFSCEHVWPKTNLSWIAIFNCNLTRLGTSGKLMSFDLFSCVGRGGLIVYFEQRNKLFTKILLKIENGHTLDMVVNREPHHPFRSQARNLEAQTSKKRQTHAWKIGSLRKLRMSL